MDEREREILECLVRGWIASDMPLYGDLSYQDVIDFLARCGIKTRVFLSSLGIYH